MWVMDGATQRDTSVLSETCIPNVYTVHSRQAARQPSACECRSRVAQWTPVWSGGACTGVSAACNNRSAVSVLSSPDKEKGSSPTTLKERRDAAFNKLASDILSDSVHPLYPTEQLVNGAGLPLSRQRKFVVPRAATERYRKSPVPALISLMNNM